MGLKGLGGAAKERGKGRRPESRHARLAEERPASQKERKLMVWFGLVRHFWSLVSDALRLYSVFCILRYEWMRIRTVTYWATQLIPHPTECVIESEAESV